MYQGVQEQVKKPFFPGISSQVVTHADPPFPDTDTQPLPPINMPKGQECAVSNTLKHGKYIIYRTILSPPHTRATC
jgi:hypothetical protein